jgi:mono/diheme cytochrome c family protein
MRFLRDALITLAVLLLMILVVAYVRIRAGGLSADAEPGTFERTVAMRLVRLSISPNAQQQQNPFREDPTAWQAAVDHFEDHCAMCHGSDGRAHTELGANMYPKVPDLADSAVQALSDGALFSVIQNGVRWTGMPAWKSEHTPEQTWQLVSFIRRVPSLTPDDLQRVPHGDHSEDTRELSDSNDHHKRADHQHDHEHEGIPAPR